jgi:hypothetical protein
MGASVSGAPVALGGSGSATVALPRAGAVT